MHCSVVSLLAPSTVRDISVEYDLSDSTQVVVRWNSPGYTPCPISGYSVQISLANKDMCSERQTDLGRVIYTTVQLNYRFRDLYANSIYEVGIAAMTEAGRGDVRTLTLHTKGSRKSQFWLQDFILPSDIGRIR